DSVRSAAIALQCFPYIVAAALRRSGTSTMGAKHFGARVARLEDPALLTGRGRFVDDIRLVGTLHACFVRSPHPHAKIRSIETSAARARPGGHAVVIADDRPPRRAPPPYSNACAKPLDGDAAHPARLAPPRSLLCRPDHRGRDRGESLSRGGCRRRRHT